MTFLTKVGSFNSGTASAGNTIGITGVGFQGKAILLWWNGRTDATDAVGLANHRQGIGFAISSSARRCVSSHSTHNTASAESDAGNRDDAVVMVLDTSGGTAGLLDFTSFDSDGFTLTVDQQMPDDVRIHYMVLGGDSLAEVAIGTLTEPASTGTQSISGVTSGGAPDAAFFIGLVNSTTNPPETSTDSRFTMGVSAGSTPVNYNIVGGSNDGATTTQTASYCRQGECIGGMPGGVNDINMRARVTSWDSTGFTLTWDEVTGNNIRQQFYLLLRGGNYAVGDILSATDTDPFSETGLGFKPAGVFFGSGCKTESSSDTIQDDDEKSLGAWDGTNQRCTTSLDKDNQADATVATAIEHDSVYANVDMSGAIVSLLAGDSLDSDGFTVHMSDAAPSASFIWYMAFGPGTAGTTDGAGAAAVAVTGAGAGASIVAGAGASVESITGAGVGESVAASDGVTSATLTGSGISESVAAAAGATAVSLTGAGVGETITQDTGVISASGTIQVSTGDSIGTERTIDLSSYGFNAQEPLKVIFFEIVGRDDGSDAASNTVHHKFGFGVATGTGNRGCVATQSEDNSATADADHVWRSDCCVSALTIDGGTDGLGDISDFSDDAFTFIIDDVFAGNYQIRWWALGGSEFAIAQFGTLALNSGTGTQDVTVTGFEASPADPDQCVVFLAADNASTIETYTKHAIGVAAGVTPDNYVMAGAANGSSDPTDASAYCRAGEAISEASANQTVVSRASVSWITNGFRITRAESAQTKGVYVAMKGPLFQAGDFLIPDDTDPFDEPIAFEPRGALFASAGRAESSSDTATVHDSNSLGFASKNAQGCVSIYDEDNQATSDVGTAIDYDDVLALMNGSGSVSEAIGVSFGSAELTLEASNPGAGTSFAWYLAIGILSIEEAVGASAVSIAISGVGEAILPAAGSSAISLTGAGVGASGAAADGASTVAITGVGEGEAIWPSAGASNAALSVAGVGASVPAGAGAGAVAVSVAAEGASVGQGDGAATVELTGAAEGASTAAADGLSACTVTGAGVATSVAEGAGASSCALTVAAEGEAVWPAVGASAVALTGSGAGASVAGADGASAIACTVLGEGASIAAGDGIASTVWSVAGTGASTAAADGTSTVVWSVHGASEGTIEGDGLSSVSLTGAGIGASVAASDGACDAVVTGAGVGVGINEGNGSCSVACTVAAEGSSVSAADGASSVTCTGSGAGASTAQADGASQLFCTVAAQGSSVAASDGSGSVVVTCAGVAEGGVSELVGSCDVVVTGDGVGTEIDSADGLSSTTITGSGVGASVAEALGSSSSTVTALGAGESTGEGSGVCDVACTVLGIGSSIGEGDGAVSCTVTGSGTGTEVKGGDGAVSCQVTVAAVSQTIGAGAGACTVVVSGSAAGSSVAESACATAVVLEVLGVSETVVPPNPPTVTSWTKGSAPSAGLWSKASTAAVGSWSKTAVPGIVRWTKNEDEELPLAA